MYELPNQRILVTVDSGGVFEIDREGNLLSQRSPHGMGYIEFALRDLDGDGRANRFDLCPRDQLKLEPGVCGCGVSDVDSDGDGVFDCLDECPGDEFKTEAGVCGCGVPDTDSDNDGAPNVPSSAKP